MVLDKNMKSQLIDPVDPCRNKTHRPIPCHAKLNLRVGHKEVAHVAPCAHDVLV